MTEKGALPGITQIGQVLVNVHDLARATAFYRDVLGLPYLFRMPNAAFFDCGGIRIMLGVSETPEFDHPASILYYKVPDLQAAFEALSSRGVQFEGKPRMIARMPDHELWMAFFRDPDENMLALMSEVNPARPTSPGT